MIDEYPEDEQGQLEWLKKATFSQRMQLVAKMCEDNFNKIRQDIRVANPDASEEEMDMLFIERNYGKELADRVRKHWKKNYAQ